MTPIRLEGDDDDEGDGDDGDGGSDEDEDEDEDEESTPIPRSKRHVVRCVFLFCFILYQEIFMFTYHGLHTRSSEKVLPQSALP